MNNNDLVRLKANYRRKIRKRAYLSRGLRQ